MAIHDDFWIWYTNGMKQKFGKPMIIDRKDYAVHHIFFDDNAREGENCNIDVRDMETGDKIPEKTFRDRYVVCVDTI